MYESFFGFHEKPFNLVPNPEVLFLSAKHRNALTHLEYGLMESVGFILLTGEVGTGKTTLIRNILNQIESEIDVAVITNTNVTPEELLYMIIEEFEIESSQLNKAQAIDKIYGFLIQKYAEQKRVLLVIDEAQNLSIEALEEIRMISNLQTDDTLLLQILLVGQPELKDKIKSERLVQLSQRISLHFHLTALTKEDTIKYIEYRITSAGGDPDIFKEETMDLIFEISQGIPRTINLLCDAALVYAYADEIGQVDNQVIEQVISDRGDLTFVGVTSKKEPYVCDNGFDASRMKQVEADIEALKEVCENLQEDVRHAISTFSDHQVNKLYSLYINEKKRVSALFSEYAKLKEKYLALKRITQEE